MVFNIVNFNKNLTQKELPTAGLLLDGERRGRIAASG
jgi:hypothetical protein